MLAPSSDALLSVGSSAQFSKRVRGVDSVEEDGFELKGQKKKGKLRKALGACFHILKAPGRQHHLHHSTTGLDGPEAAFRNSKPAVCGM